MSAAFGPLAVRHQLFRKALSQQPARRRTICMIKSSLSILPDEKALSWYEGAFLRTQHCHCPALLTTRPS